MCACKSPKQLLDAEEWPGLNPHSDLWQIPSFSPQILFLNMAGLRIEVSKLDLRTGTTAVESHKPAFRRAGHSLGVQPTCGTPGWKIQEHFQTNQSWSDPSAVGTAWGLGKLGI